MLKNKIVLTVYIVLFTTVVLFVYFGARTNHSITEMKVGEIVHSKNFLLKVLEVHSAFDGVTRIGLIIRNLTDKPIRFLVTDRFDKSNDLGYRKYYFVVERNRKIYSTCCTNHLVEPGDESGNSDYRFDIYLAGLLPKAIIISY